MCLLLGNLVQQLNWIQTMNLSIHMSTSLKQFFDLSHHLTHTSCQKNSSINMLISNSSNAFSQTESYAAGSSKWWLSITSHLTVHHQIYVPQSRFFICEWLNVRQQPYDNNVCKTAQTLSPDVLRPTGLVISERDTFCPGSKLSLAFCRQENNVLDHHMSCRGQESVSAIGCQGDHKVGEKIPPKFSGLFPEP